MLVRFFRGRSRLAQSHSALPVRWGADVRGFCDDSGMAHRILRHLFLLVSLCIALGSCGYGISDGKLTMDFSPLQIQNAIAPKFPQENCPTPLTCIQLSNPKVTLPENANRIQLNFDTTVKLFQQPITGTAIISAQPRYQSTTGEIFLDDAMVQDLQLRGVSTNVTKTATQYGSTLAQLALQRSPIYSFKNASAEKIAKMGITDVKVVEGKLRITIDPLFRQGAK
jgi:hypothetical protein